jgi:hypothetical protein
MQQNDDQFAQQRVATHTKLFEIEGRQLVAFLNRDDSDALVVILQLWVAATDEQLRVAVRCADEPSTQEMFDLLDTDTIQFMLSELKVPELIAELSNGR